MEWQAIVRKAGGLRNGYERGKGTVYHCLEYQNGEKDFVIYGGFAALCGATPAIQWASQEGEKITCPKCLRKLGM